MAINMGMRRPTESFSIDWSRFLMWIPPFGALLFITWIMDRRMGTILLALVATLLFASIARALRRSKMKRGGDDEPFSGAGNPAVPLTPLGGRSASDARDFPN